MVRTIAVVNRDEEYCLLEYNPSCTNDRKAITGVRRKRPGLSDKNSGLDSAGHRKAARAPSQQTGKDNMTQIPCGVSNQCPHRYQALRFWKLPTFISLASVIQTPSATRTAMCYAVRIMARPACVCNSGVAVKVRLSPIPVTQWRCCCGGAVNTVVVKWGLASAPRPA